jgi:plasmid stabilization system protein ParE
MDYSVILSDVFASDLDGIIAHLMTRAGVETASRIGNELLDRALEIGESPFIGQLVKKRFGARKVLLYRYIIYYDVNETQQTVEVLRVWHGARDAKSLRFS